MKKIIALIGIIFLSVNSYSQVVKIDSIQCNQSEIIAERLHSFHNENRLSQILFVSGVGVITWGALEKNPSSENSKNIKFLVGGILSAASIVLNFDSFKYLEFINKKPIKKYSEDYL